MTHIGPELVLLWASLLGFVLAGVPLQRFQALVNSQSIELGLYNASDKVNILTTANFADMVLHQNHSTLVEFYNSYCGHCKRFAPHYKQLAEDIYSWRDVLSVSAIDCADEENNDICREYEIMGYPTLRYISPAFSPAPENYGRTIITQELPVIRSQLAMWLAAENRTVNMTLWPNFQNLTEEDSQQLFHGLDSAVKFVVLVYEPEETTIGLESILHFIRYPGIVVRRVNDIDVAKKFNMDDKKYRIVTIDRNGNKVSYTTKSNTIDSYVLTIQSVLTANHMKERPSVTTPVSNIKQNSSSDTLISTHHDPEKNNEIIREVLSHKTSVYQADLEMAIRGILFNEIPRIANITGERLLALQRILALLNRYNPLGDNGRTMVKKLYEHVMQFNQEISGKAYEQKLKELEQQLAPVFSSTHFVGCIASQSSLRGFTCSLWQLFHFMTVQAAQNELSQDPIEVLQAMHGYVKYYFGCTDCAEHFQDMAVRRKIWSVPNKDEAILWLWAAHNEVNQRLAGDNTEDPKFPKIQFPSQTDCAECYKQPITTTSYLNIHWDKDAVLAFLKHLHNAEHINRYGVDNEKILQPTLEKLRQKRMLSNVFSDIDMRMGMLLYGFCIVMLIIAFKLFVFKGYRKKPYGHDVLGKV